MEAQRTDGSGREEEDGRRHHRRRRRREQGRLNSGYEEDSREFAYGPPPPPPPQEVAPEASGCNAGEKRGYHSAVTTLAKDAPTRTASTAGSASQNIILADSGYYHDVEGKESHFQPQLRPWAEAAAAIRRQREFIFFPESSSKFKATFY
jgi:hypothetical protein